MLGSKRNPLLLILGCGLYWSVCSPGSSYVHVPQLCFQLVSALFCSFFFFPPSPDRCAADSFSFSSITKKFPGWMFIMQILFINYCKETSYRKSHMQRHMLAVSTLLGCKTVNLFFFSFFTVLYGLTLSGQFDNKLFTYHLLLYVNAWSQPVRCLREADWPSVSSPTCSLLRLPLILKKITVCADAGRFPPFSRTSFSYFVYLL